MGGKGSKSHTKPRGQSFSIETPHTYFKDNLSYELPPPIRKFKQTFTKVPLPNDLWICIFRQVDSISFLSLASQVCQVWYKASMDDILWRPFVLWEDDSQSTLSCREKAYQSHLIQKKIVLPDSYKNSFYLTTVHSDSVKIVIMGNTGVGKTSISVQFINGIFIDDKYDPTIEGSMRISRNFHKNKISLGYDVLDTSGSEQFVAMRDLYIKNGQVFILVYSIVSQSSFNDIESLYQDILTINGSNPKPMILVGNKTDLNRQRVISTAQGANLAQKLNIGFVETCAKEKSEIESLFRMAAELHCIQSTPQNNNDNGPRGD